MSLLSWNFPHTGSGSSLGRDLFIAQRISGSNLDLLRALHMDVRQKPIGGGLKVSLCTFMVFILVQNGRCKGKFQIIRKKFFPV